MPNTKKSTKNSPQTKVKSTKSASKAPANEKSSLKEKNKITQASQKKTAAPEKPEAKKKTKVSSAEGSGKKAKQPIKKAVKSLPVVKEKKTSPKSTKAPNSKKTVPQAKTSKETKPKTSSAKAKAQPAKKSSKPVAITEKKKEKAAPAAEKEKKVVGRQTTKAKEEPSNPKAQTVLKAAEEPKKRGRKKKAEASAITLKKTVGSKRAKSKEAEAEEDFEGDNLFEDIDTDLSLSDDSLADPMMPIKRRPGRPAKPKDQTAKIINFPSAAATLRIPKKENTKPKKPLSSTLPGTALAELFANNSFTEKKSVVPSEKTESKISPDDLLNKEASVEADASSLPSWEPRNWVTREGERLIIRGNELVKEEQFGKLDAESTSGVISPEEVEEVIRRIRESYKKKAAPKKS